jgi:LytS/YehU family sensor histidine kinase/ligand-binding sensor domain-containing protein
LPIEVCSYISKDSEGFLWISTFDGLCRYDGKNLVVFKNDPANNNSIADNHIGYTLEDKEGNIWVTHRKGVSCFIKKEGKFKNYKTYINLKGDTSNIPYNPIVMDYLGNIYSPDFEGYENKIFDKKTNSFKQFFIDTANDGFNKKGFNNKLVGVLSKAQQDGSMYLQSINGTFSFDPKTKKRTRICDSSNYTPLYIFKDYKKQLWLSEWNGGLSIIDEKTKLKKTIIPKNRIAAIVDYKDVNGKQWLIASDMQTSSIFIIDPETKAYTSQVFKLENETTATINAAMLLADEQSRLYVIGVLGLAEANPSKQYISSVYTYERGKPVDIYYDNLVRSGVQKADGGYIVGLLGYNGLREYDSNLELKKVIKNYNYNGKNYDLDVRNFLSIGNNKIIMSGLTGIALLEGDKITPYIYTSKKDLPKDTLIYLAREMLPINNTDYWVRIMNKGISIFSTSTNNFVKHYQFADKARTISLSNIRNILYDHKKILWLLDLDALYLYDNATDEFIKQPINESKKYLTSLYNMSIENDNIWITGVGGLLQYNIVTKKESFYSTKNGLPNEMIYKVTFYDKENVCILHERGLSILNTTTGQIYNYNQKHGLPSTSIEYDGCFFLDNSKHLMMGNTGVLTKVDIANLVRTNSGSPRIAITDVAGCDSSILITLNDKNEKHAYLDFKNFPVNINFSIIDFSANGERKYFYRYTGKDTTWIPCANGVVPINTIEPGDYTLQVMGSVNGVYTSKIESITFTIVPRWHQTWWAKLMMGILLFMGVGSLYRWRIKTAKKSQKQQTEIQRLAAQEYKNQLELTQISNYFSTSVMHLETIDEVLWDVAKKLIGELGFEDCMIYLWDKDKTKLIQKAGYGPKGSIEEINKQPFDVVLGQGVVGYVAQYKESVLIADTRKDIRYRPDEMERLSEICVPILDQNQLIGIIDSENSNLNFYTPQHLQILTTIATNLANKITEIKSKQAIKENEVALQKTQDLLRNAQLEALRSQMNPHFIFNCLNSIKLYTTQNNTEAAVNYLTKFSKLIRMALENSRSQMVSLQNELDALELYIELEAMRFKDKLQYTITVHNDVDTEFIEIPPLLLQPFVENAIWHGIMHKEEGGNIDITIDYTSGHEALLIKILDNGIGRAKSAQLKSKSATTHKSFGTKVTHERVDIINQIYKTGASVTTKDVIENGMVAGTLVTIKIPLV